MSRYTDHVAACATCQGPDGHCREGLRLKGEPEIEEPISINIFGEVKGFRYKGETRDEAAARLVLEAEQNGNSGKARIHLQIKAGE